MLQKRLGWIVFFFLVLYFIFFIRQDIINNLELKKDIQHTGLNIGREENQIKDFHSRLNGMQKEGYVEGLARTHLGLVKKGETAYKIY